MSQVTRLGMSQGIKRPSSVPQLLMASTSSLLSAAARLSKHFTPTYATKINAQIVAPAQAVLVKPNELESALARPLNVAVYEPYRQTSYLAATLSYGIIKNHPFLDGNKRTGFFLANEYLRAQGLPGLVEFGKVGEIYGDVDAVVEHLLGVADGSTGLNDYQRSDK
ncbi:hypothetical protein VKT23_014368 [Stygiomarasmius scandens]|uniref:Fido domain-containing protein n=1 Tax=Marasmiellus scandens TaxID=2682957 RepID=A0ABR1J0W1_9AGAR